MFRFYVTNHGVFMHQFIAPSLYCPFPCQINKYADVLEDYALKWALSFNLIANESARSRFCKAKFFWLIAATYPNCQLEELKIANDWLSWFITWDDECDMLDLSNQPEVQACFHNRFIEILNGAELTNQDTPRTHALSDIRHRILQTGGAKTFHNFVRSVEDYLHGYVQEAINRRDGTVPDIHTYIILRRLTGAMEPLFELIEFCNHLMLPNFLREHEIWRNLKIKTNNIVCWCNDIFSAPKEMASGDVHNLVLVLHYQQQLPLEQAIKRAAEIHNQEVCSMMNLEAFMPSFGEEVDAELAKYISGLHAWISGHCEWYAQTGRYQFSQRQELVKA